MPLMELLHMAYMAGSFVYIASAEMKKRGMKPLVNF